MGSRRKNIIILCALIIVLITIGIFVYIYFSKENSLDVLLINDNKQNEAGEEYSQSNLTPSNEDSNYTSIDNNEIIEEDNNYEEIANDNNYSEEEVVSYFESMETEIETSSSFKDKFKDYFITIVDFIFYDSEIKGYTFSELSGTAKVRIISIALKIDSKIEEYVPNYKENISSTTGVIYTNIKEKLVTSYMDISSTICKDNKEECAVVKEIFSEIKDKCKIGWDFIKGLVKDGTSKVKEWYEIYSGK